MLFANNANTTLASSLTSGATSMSVTSATGFPSPTGVQYFYCTLADAATQTTIEIVKVTSVSGTTFAITRAQDGTSATAFSAGALVSLRLVRASLNDFPKLDETNTFNADQAISGQLTSSAGLATTGTFTATAPSDGLVMDYATGFGRFSAFAGDGFQWYNAGIANTKLMQLSSTGVITTATWNGATVGVAYGGTGVTASSGANSVVLRDSNQNVFANNFIPNTTTTVASSTPINLTVASAQYQIVTGSVTSQTFNMPDATTLTVGDTYYFNNNITYSSVQINAHDGSTSLLALQAGGAAHLVLLTNSTSNGTWDVHSYIPSTVSWGNATLNFNSSSSISGSVSWLGNAVGVAYGGTGLTSLTAGYIPYGNGTSAFSFSSTLTYNGTSLNAGNFVPGSSSVPTNGIYYPASNVLGFSTNTTFVGSFDASGRLIVGVASNFFSNTKLQLSGGGMAIGNLGNGFNPMGFIYSFNNDSANGGLTFSTQTASSMTEKARIDSSGNMLVGLTSSYLNNCNIQSSTGLAIANNSAGSSYRLYLAGNDNNHSIYSSGSGGNTMYFCEYGNWNFFSTISNSTVATINNSGVYTPLSDVNRKKDFEQSNIGLKEILNLKPTLFRMLEDDETTDKQLGFIAQEVKKFIPQAYYEENSFIGLQDRPIIAALVKAVQELNDKFDAYVASHS